MLCQQWVLLLDHQFFHCWLAKVLDAATSNPTPERFRVIISKIKNKDQQKQEVPMGLICQRSWFRHNYLKCFPYCTRNKNPSLAMGCFH